MLIMWGLRMAKYNKFVKPRGGDYDKTVMYDAHEQQYLDMKQLDQISLMWMQVLRIGQNSGFDPEEGGKEMLVQVGGANGIIEKKYIPHPFARYYYCVQHLFDLLINDIDGLAEDDKVRIQKTWLLLQDVDEKSRDAYKYSSKLFRDLQRVIKGRYGEQDAYIDVINPEVALRLREAKEAAKSARQNSE